MMSANLKIFAFALCCLSCTRTANVVPSQMREQENSAVSNLKSNDLKPKQVPVPTYMGFALGEKILNSKEWAEESFEILNRPDDHDETYLALAEVASTDAALFATSVENRLFLLREDGTACSADLGGTVLLSWSFPDFEEMERWSSLKEPELLQAMLEKGHVYRARRVVSNDECVAEYGWGVLSTTTPGFEYAHAEDVTAEHVDLSRVPYLDAWRETWRKFRKTYLPAVERWPSVLDQWEVMRARRWNFENQSFAGLAVVSFDLSPPLLGEPRIAGQPWLEFSGLVAFQDSNVVGPEKQPLRGEEAVSSVVVVGERGARFLLVTSSRGMWGMKERDGQFELAPRLDAGPSGRFHLQP